ncbi:MAG: hypothetical protein J6U70_01810 [Bacteroidales bacterium]|nr:hypothetical protein [Bacteroidales bacterium]
MKKTVLIRFALLPLLLLCFVSCQSDRIRQELLAVETYLNAEPERALRVLDSMDVEDLHRRRDRAHYALLKSMALDKNYIDLTSDSLIAPAVAYYSRHGTADEKMKAYYYQGRVYQNAGEDERALLSFLESETWMSDVEDHRMNGLVYMAMRHIYDMHYCSEEENRCLELGIQEFLLAEDTLQYHIALIDKAKYYQSIDLWSQADSVYESLPVHQMHKYVVQDYYVNYALNNLIKPVPDARKSISLYDTLIMKYDYRIDRDDAGRLAYAYRMLGDTETSNYLLSLYDRPDSDYWGGYRIALLEGDEAKQVLYLQALAEKQNRYFEQVLSQSTLRIVSEYHSQQHQHQLKLKERQQYVFLLLFLMLLVVSVAIYRHLLHRKRIQQESYENMLSTLRYANSRMESSQNELEDKFVDLYREKFKVVNDLYFLYSRSGLETSLHHELMMQKITELFSGIEEEGRLATILDQDLDNLIRDMRSEVDLTDQEVLLICFFVIKLDTRIISCITNLSTASIYTRKSRIIKKIESLSSSSKSKYLRYLR